MGWPAGLFHSVESFRLQVNINRALLLLLQPPTSRHFVLPLPLLPPLFSLCRGLLYSWRTTAGRATPPFAGDGVHQAGLIPSRGAKLSTADPNVSYLYSDLTQLRPYMHCTNFKFFPRSFRVYLFAPISYTGSASCLFSGSNFVSRG